MDDIKGTLIVTTATLAFALMLGYAVTIPIALAAYAITYALTWIIRWPE